MSSRKHQKDLKSSRQGEACGVWTFGPFTVDAREGRLAHEGQPVAITPKAFEALVFLLARHGQLVTRQQLLDALWPDTFVGDASLTSVIWTVRRALGGSDEWVETVPKRGYRFVGNAREKRSRVGSDTSGATSRGTTSIEAYQLWLQGRHLCHAWPTAAFHRSRDCFERAIRLDPKYAEAHFGLALYHGIGAAMGLLPPVEGWRAFQVSLATAIRLDETLGENFNGIAAVHLYLHRNWQEAERAFTQALTIDPDDAETRNHYGGSLALFGRFEEAVGQIERAIELDPLSLRFQFNLATVFHQSGRYDQAIDQCRRTLSLDTKYLHANALMGDAYEQKGDLPQALLHWQRAGGHSDADNTTVERLWTARLDTLMDRIRIGEFVPAMDVARAHARLGDIDATIDWLTKALHERSRLILELPVDPLFQRFRSDPRWDSIVAALPNGHLAGTPSVVRRQRSRQV
jgi:DNA-binding winged helix-turn-helix (wHTH) protein/tetratricopeptide (TPR) repeat protein